jgi:hypothetical protein
MSYAIVSRVLGLFLLVTAALKLYGVTLDPAGRIGIFSGPEWQVGILEMEVLLALWLLSGSNPVGAWLTSLLAFSSFAVASFYQGWIGEASCGCFGAVKVNPWFTFSLDVVIVAALALCRPNLRELHEQPRTQLASALLPVVYGTLGVTLMLGILTGVAYASYGSTHAAIAHLRGERISISPRVLDMGVGQPGDVREASIKVSNWSESPIRLIGGTSDCSCVVTDELPLTIAPGESCSLTVKMRLSGGRGTVNRKALLMTDDKATPRVGFRLAAEITPSAITAQSHNGH